MWTKTFWKAVAERSFWTFIQAFGGILIAAGITDVRFLDWGFIFGSAGFALLLAVVKNIAVAGITDGNPSTVSAETLDTTEGDAL